MSSSEDKLNRFIRFEFPNPKKCSNGDINEVCRSCGNWVINKSTFLQRYYQLHGVWQNEAPIGDSRVAPSTTDGKKGTSTIPICDFCIEKYNGSYPLRFVIMHHAFIVHASYRMND